MGAKALNDHFRLAGPVEAVKEGQTLDLGDMKLVFHETRMLHWPDSMVSYLADERVLFSQDIFGMHLASSKRFADELPADELEYEAAKYYANIILPYSPIVSRLLATLPSFGHAIDLIAPDHGPMWRTEVTRPIERYAKWAAQEPSKKVVVVYDTMWQSTAVMARAIADGAAGAGATVKVMPLSSAHRSDVMTELMGSGALVVGSPTINNQLFPTLADCMVYARGLRPKVPFGAAFGSYGWSGEAPGLLETMLGEMKIQKAADAVKVRYVPDEAAREACRRLGVQVAEKLP
jgi:flavorubredoxin